MLDYYKKLITKSKCVQILTNEIAIPYLLDKPTCTDEVIDSLKLYAKDTVGVA